MQISSLVRASLVALAFGLAILTWRGVAPAQEPGGLVQEAPPSVLEPLPAPRKSDERFQRFLQPLDTLSTDIKPQSGRLPKSFGAEVFSPQDALGQVPAEYRPVEPFAFDWEATGIYHQPLYFEQPNLERHGYSLGLLQPVASGAHFFATVPALPYLMAATPPRWRVYSLGHSRPGSVTDYRVIRPPLSLRGAAAQSLIVTGLIFVVP